MKYEIILEIKCVEKIIMSPLQALEVAEYVEPLYENFEDIYGNDSHRVPLALVESYLNGAINSFETAEEFKVSQQPLLCRLRVRVNVDSLDACPLYIFLSEV